MTHTTPPSAKSSMKCRTEVPNCIMQKINELSLALGYTGKRFDSKVSRWKLVEKLLDYAKIHGDLFKQ